jgi:hypothetical protein
VKGFDVCEIRHIRRIHNSRADWLASYAMQSGQSYGFNFLDQV